MKYKLPRPNGLTRENVQLMNGTAWRQLAILAAGLPIEDLGASLPDQEDRRSAAALIARALELWQANVLASIKGTPGFDELVADPSRTEMAGFIGLQRQGLQGLKAGMPEELKGKVREVDRLREAVDNLGGDAALPGLIELTRNIILAYEVLQAQRESPVEALTVEEFLALWKATLYEAWEEEP